MKNIKQLIEDQIILEESYIQEHEAIKTILQGLIGKPFDGRTFNAKRLQGFTYVHEYSMHYIIGKYRHMIGYSSNPFVDVTAFEDHDACHNKAAKNRIRQMQALNVDRLQAIQDSIAESFNNIVNQFKALDKEKFDSYNNPVYYDMLRAIYNEEHGTRSARVVLSDFYYIAKDWKRGA